MFDHFEQSVIPLLKRNGIRSMLYVGWRRDCKPWWHDHMAKELGVTDLGVLEIFPKNVADLEQQVWAGRYDCRVIQGDARDPKKSIGLNDWDLIFWDHGPEHVTAEDLKVATEELFRCCRKALLYCCPWGDWPQGEEDGNVHEVHRNAVTKEQLFDLGFTLFSTGAEGQQGEGELVALMGK
jgi:hypothetical protein